MRAPTQHFHVSEAYLCPCGMIGNSAMQCACGQEQGLLQLSTVLDQAPAPQPTNAQVWALIDKMDEVLSH